MNTLIIIGSILVILGIMGSILPALPGPILGFLGIVLLFFAKGSGVIPISALVIFGVGTLILIVIDYVAPILGAKFFGASKRGIWGAILGGLAGLIVFPPLGIFVGSFVGAYLGEFLTGKNKEEAIRAAMGTVLGSVFMIILQVIFSLIMAIYFFIKLF